jgi:hypothetical protein
LDIDCCRYSHLLTAVTALANSPPLEVRHVVRAVFLTFPVNLVFLPAALVLVSFIARQAVVLVTLPAAVRRSEAHRERTRLWWWGWRGRRHAVHLGTKWNHKLLGEDQQFFQ